MVNINNMMKQAQQLQKKMSEAQEKLNSIEVEGISGGGVVKFSKNKQHAIALLEFLTSEEAQKLYGEINFEYPVNPKISATQELISWGEFREDKLPIIKIAELAYKAQVIIDKVGW